MNNVIHIKGTREAPKAARSTMETVVLSVDEVNQWRVPPFQRPVRINERVRGIADGLKRGDCELSGVITLGKIGKDPTIYTVDGQHRIEGFRMSGVREVIADLRVCQFESMSEMADEFVMLNSAIVRMRPDDILRGLEPSVSSLRYLREKCEFVGYDQIRRGSHGSPIVSASAVIRMWQSSANEAPANGGGSSAANCVAALDQDSAQNLTVFLLTAHAAWGRDPEYYRLWGNLNIALCMWLWRRLVLDRDRSGTKRIVSLNVSQFKQCLMSLSADQNYLDWLQGRSLGDRDRSPCYSRIKSIFVRRLREESKSQKTPMLPSPAWASK